MKKIIALSFFLLSLGIQASSEIELNAKEININADKAIVVRTSRSPETIQLTFKVPMENSVCERRETRYVLRTSGAYCGYDRIERRIPVGQICVKTHPRDGRCLRYEETYRFEYVERPRTCQVPETYCAQYGTRVSFEEQSMKIKFKDLTPLAGSERETFSIEATQKRFDSGSVIFEVEPLETLREYKVERKKVLFIKTHTYEISEK